MCVGAIGHRDQLARRCPVRLSRFADRFATEKAVVGLQRAHRRYGVASVCLVLLAAGPVAAAGQVSAALSGIISDASGAAISGAGVTARKLETGAVRTTATDAAGRYQLRELAVGSYEVTVA